MGTVWILRVENLWRPPESASRQHGFPAQQSRHASPSAMTNVAILPESSVHGEIEYRAMASGRQALAKTAGAALDALTAQLEGDASGTLVIVQNHGPDQFFTAGQQQRLAELMVRWRSARDGGTEFSAAERAELDALVEAEAQASGERASVVLESLRK